MNEIWWGLPGPRSFVDELEEHLRDGRNVVLMLPDSFPGGLWSALEVRLRQSDWYVDAISPSLLTMTPLDAIYESLAIAEHNDYPRSIGALLREDHFIGRTILCDLEGSDKAKEWVDFIQHYQTASKATSRLERSKFCLSLYGAQTAVTVQEDVYLSVMHWDGYVTSLDMMLYSYYRLGHIAEKNMERELAVNIAARLACWDPSVIESFRDAGMEGVLHPLVVVETMMQQRGWEIEPLSNGTACKWQAGVTYTIGGKQCLHSAYLMLTNGTEELRKRIWAGQIASIFPFIEECRMRILDHGKKYLTIPYRVDDHTMIADYRDLEIGHICYQIQTSQKYIPKELSIFIQILRDMRNTLAHLDPIDSAEIDNEYVRDYDKILSIF